MPRWIWAAVVAISILVAGCSGNAASPPSASPSTTASLVPASPSATASASPTQSAIVGEWVGVHDCERIVPMLLDAGQTDFLADPLPDLIGREPGPAELKDPIHLCDDAVKREHSHFFTASGEFGSKDYRGQQVDDGTYTLEGDDVIVINGSRFKYEIVGDQLTLDPEPVDTSACTTKPCRFEATWVLMVAMPGMTWSRGEIKSQ